MGKRARRIRQLRKLGVEPPPQTAIEIRASLVDAYEQGPVTYKIAVVRLTGEELQAFWPGRTR